MGGEWCGDKDRLPLDDNPEQDECRDAAERGIVRTTSAESNRGSTVVMIWHDPNAPWRISDDKSQRAHRQNTLKKNLNRACQNFFLPPKNVRPKVQEVTDRLLRILQHPSGKFKVDRCAPGGSYGKHTDTCLKVDLDIVVFISTKPKTLAASGFDPDADLLGMKEEIFAVWRQDLGRELGLAESDFSGKAALTFFYKGIEIDLLPAPSYAQSTKEHSKIVLDKMATQSSKTGSRYSTTLAEIGIAFVREQPAIVNALCRLTKFWQNGVHIEKYVDGRSFIFECIAIYVWRSLSESDQDNILYAFCSFLECLKEHSKIVLDKMATQSSKTGSRYSTTLAEIGIAFVREQPAIVNALCRLTKFWQNGVHIEKYVDGRSFIFECIAIYVWRSLSESDRDNILYAFCSFLECLKVLPSVRIDFPECYQEYVDTERYEFVQLLHDQRPGLYLPNNPFGNILAGDESMFHATFASAADQTLLAIMDYTNGGQEFSYSKIMKPWGMSVDHLEGDMFHTIIRYDPGMNLDLPKAQKNDPTVSLKKTKQIMKHYATFIYLKQLDIQEKFCSGALSSEVFEAMSSMDREDNEEQHQKRALQFQIPERNDGLMGGFSISFDVGQWRDPDLKWYDPNASWRISDDTSQRAHKQNVLKRHFNRACQQFLQPSAKVRRHFRRVTDQLIQILKQSCGKFKVDRCVPGGSFAKNTDIRLSRDLNIVVFISTKARPMTHSDFLDWDATLIEMKAEIFEVWRLDLGQHLGLAEGDFSGEEALTFLYEGIAIDLLPAPSYAQCAKDHAQIALNKMTTQSPGIEPLSSRALAEIGINFVKEQPPRVNDLCRLTKFWQNGVHIEGYIDDRSFLFECITIYVCRSLSHFEGSNIFYAFCAFLECVRSLKQVRVDFPECYKEFLPMAADDTLGLYLPNRPFDNVLANDKTDFYSTFARAAEQTLGAISNFTNGVLQFSYSSILRPWGMNEARNQTHMCNFIIRYDQRMDIEWPILRSPKVFLMKTQQLMELCATFILWKQLDIQEGFCLEPLESRVFEAMSSMGRDNREAQHQLRNTAIQIPSLSGGFEISFDFVQGH
eukprot:maker-scaffold658_size117954-snap-gene-0.36 protein:Tk06734 transcript:maker-scaffold658_size117954-snap-gene-0.36-mRNA-1 annotation:"low quality protein: 2 -5 -oligoadenylate synthase 3"